MATTPKKVRAASFKWPGEMEKEFCEALEEFPVLWDSYCPDYCVRDKRIAAQEAMGRLFHIPSKEVFMRLKSLRTAFTRALNKKPKSGSAGDINLYTDREKRLLELMKFIIPHIRPSKTISSLPVLEKDTAGVVVLSGEESADSGPSGVEEHRAIHTADTEPEWDDEEDYGYYEISRHTRSTPIKKTAPTQRSLSASPVFKETPTKKSKPAPLSNPPMRTTRSRVVPLVMDSLSQNAPNTVGSTQGKGKGKGKGRGRPRKVVSSDSPVDGASQVSKALGASPRNNRRTSPAKSPHSSPRHKLRPSPAKSPRSSPRHKLRPSPAKSPRSSPRHKLRPSPAKSSRSPPHHSLRSSPAKSPRSPSPPPAKSATRSLEHTLTATEAEQGASAEGPGPSTSAMGSISTVKTNMLPKPITADLARNTLSTQVPAKKAPKSTGAQVRCDMEREVLTENENPQAPVPKKRKESSTTAEEDASQQSLGYLKTLTDAAVGQYARDDSEDYLWGRLLVKRVVRMGPDRKEKFKRYVDNCSHECLDNDWIPPNQPDVPSANHGIYVDGRQAPTSVPPRIILDKDLLQAAAASNFQLVPIQQTGTTTLMYKSNEENYTTRNNVPQ